MNRSGSMGLFWLGLKAAMAGQQKSIAQKLKEGWGRYLKIGALATACYVGLLSLYIAMLVTIPDGVFMASRDPVIHTDPNISHLVAYQAENEKSASSNETLKVLVKTVKELKWADAYITDIKSRTDISELMTYANVLRLDNQLSAPVLSASPSQWKMEFNLVQGFEAITGKEMPGESDQRNLAKHQYQSMPSQAQEAYKLYVKHEIIRELKFALVIGWLYSAAALFMMGSVCIVVVHLSYYVAVVKIFGTGKKKFEELKGKGEQLYEEDLAKREKEILTHATAGSVKTKVPSRPKSL